MIRKTLFWVQNRENTLMSRIQGLELELSRARDQQDDSVHLEDASKIRSVRFVMKIDEEIRPAEKKSPAQLQDVIQTLETERDRAIRDALDAQNSFEIKSAKMKELREQLYLVEREHKAAKNFVQTISGKTDEIQGISNDVRTMANQVMEQCRRIESLVQQHVAIENGMKASQTDLLQKSKSMNGMYNISLF
jgi:uncharacterized coiled-coil DUF342 family protein